MNKKLMSFLTFGLVVALMGLGWSSLAAADETAALPIAVVDGNQVFQRFQPAIETELKNEFKDQQQDLMKKQEELQKLSEQLDKDAEIMSEKEVTALQEKFAEKQMAFQQLSVEYSESYNERGNAMFQALIEKVQNAAKELAVEKKYAMVVQRAAVLYADDKYDVTEDLIKKVEATK